MDTRFENTDGYLLVVCAGRWEPEVVKTIVGEIRGEAERVSQTRILVDWSGVGDPPQEFDRFVSGLMVSELLPPPYKTAVVYRAEAINKFAENTARNRGASFYVCADKDEALAWLRGVDRLGDVASEREPA